MKFSDTNTNSTADLSLRKLVSIARRRTPQSTCDKAPAKISVVKAQRKRVRFATTASVVRRSLSKEELAKAWYQRADYYDFDRERRSTVYAVKQVNGDLSSLDPAKYCLRGLEHHLSKKQMIDRKLRAMRCKRVVLEQQHYQRFSGVSDPGSLQAVSELFSARSSKSAQLRALNEHTCPLR
jgi:hypothetical protein